VATHGVVPALPLPMRRRAAGRIGALDGALQTYAPPLIPLPMLSFDGLSSTDDQNAIGGRLSPPDTNGDVGPNHYVQIVNVLARVYGKDGTPLTAPFRLSSLFHALGGICSTTDSGDPIVLYDPLADRWLLSEFAFNSTNPPYHQCVAVSTTPDPTGAYYLYDFVMPGNNFNDYPHFGVWADGYYMTDNQFLDFTTFDGAGAFAFDRTKMLAGAASAGFIYFDLGPDSGGMLPADLDGHTPPPAGAPEYFAMLAAPDLALPGDAPAPPDYGMHLYAFHADFTTPSASTFTELPESPVAVAPFDPVNPDGRNDIEQPLPATSIDNLDSIQDRLMHRLAYRNFGGTRESLVVTHTVNVGPDPDTPSGHQAAIRYYEFRRSLPGGAFTVPEQATFAPDSDNRWMGSAAMDGQGNIAVGYSVSSVGTYPSVRYAGRLATDPPNGLYQGEGVLAIGTGVQLSTGGRWGDYSALSIDPSDDCTFWYTNEYYTALSQASSSVGWVTRIGTFRFPNCGTPAPQGAVTGIVTDATTGAPMPGVVLAFSPGGTGVTTDAGGVYHASVPVGTYAVTASAAFHASQSIFGLAVANGSTTTLNFKLTLQPDWGVVTGVVRNATTGDPLTNAQIAIGNLTTSTDVRGVYVFNLQAGGYRLTASNPPFYLTSSAVVNVSNQTVTSQDFSLSLPSNTGLLTGHVRDAVSLAPIPDAVVNAGGATASSDDSGAYELLLPAGSYRVSASVPDYLDAAATGVTVTDQVTTTEDLALQTVTFSAAAYDATMRTPSCAAGAASCDSGTLLVGRDSLAGGAEPNQPNTIFNSCADGGAGTFHVNESLDRLAIYTLDGGPFASGTTVRIEATVFAAQPSDRLDLFVTATAATPAWTLLATFAPPGPGVQTFSATYVLPAGSLQAVRGSYRFEGTASPCTSGSLDDHDDLVFAPAGITGQVTDALTGLPIPGASVSAGSGGTAVTDAAGDYVLSPAPGTFTVAASAPGHVSQTTPGVVFAGSGAATVNFALALSAGTGVLTGHVRSASTNAAVAGAVVAAGSGRATTAGDGSYALFLAAGTYAATASAAGYASLGASGLGILDHASTAHDFALSPAPAAYDAGFKAPVCALAGASCQSGALLVGRDTIAGGPEPNQPNTIHGSCADGTSGTFHSDESIDEVDVSSVDGTTIVSGQPVRVDVKVWVFSPAVDQLEFYAATDATNPTWQYLGTVVPAGTGAQTLSLAYVLPAGTLQAVRARFGDMTITPSGTPCAGTTFSYDDTDDLVFAVTPGNEAASSPPRSLAAAGMAAGSPGAVVSAVAPGRSAPHPAPWWTAGGRGLAVTPHAAPRQPFVVSPDLEAAPGPPAGSRPAPAPPLLDARALASIGRRALLADAADPPPFPVVTVTNDARARRPRAAGSARQLDPQAAPGPQWEVEGLAGGLLASQGGGKGTLPAPGPTFMTANGYPTRAVPSWYFGDGAKLLNQVNEALGVSQQIAPLDGALTSAIVRRAAGRSLGLRVSRVLTPRLTIEFTLQYGRPPALTPGGAAAIDASRASFPSAWNGLFASGNYFASAQSLSTVTTTAGRSQSFITGAVNVALRTHGRAIPYVTIGGGANPLVATPQTTILGTYQFVLNGVTTIAEGDKVTLHHETSGSVVAVVGSGVKYLLSPHAGVRLDTRVYLGAKGFDNYVDTKISSGSGTAGSVASITTPAIQFGNSPSTGIQSSLSGTALSSFRTFAGGRQRQVSLTVGFYIRF